MEPAEIPTIPEGMTPDAAKAALDKIHAAAACDVTHAYTNGHHPQHAAMTRATAALHEIYAQRPDAGKSPTTRACEAALAAVDAKKDMLAQDIEAEIDTLHELGFEGEGPTGDPAPHHLTGLKMQRLHAQGDYDALMPMMEKELHALRASAQTIQQFQEFVNNPDVDTELRAEITEKLVGWIHRANVARAAGKPKPSAPDMENRQ
jgi:hypothetical protein